jgi:uncharacterized membrane protein required for colicin V production
MTLNLEHISMSGMNALFAAAAAAPKDKPAVSMDSFDLMWFDVISVILLVVGFVVGKKRGMSLELLDVFQWLLIVVVASLYYAPLAGLLSSLAGLGRLTSNIICYVTIAVVIKVAFTAIKTAVGEKIVGSDLFGRMEYYFGALAGLTRFFCMIMVALAIMHAEPVDVVAIQKAKEAQTKELGSTFFPSIAEIRQQMLYKSILGRNVREHLSDQLISPTAGTGTVTKPVNREKGAGAKREKALEDAVNPPAPKEAPKEKK